MNIVLTYCAPLSNRRMVEWEARASDVPNLAVGHGSDPQLALDDLWEQLDAVGYVSPEEAA